MAGLNAAQYGVGAVITTLFHPFGYAKVLIQLGHEPLAPVSTRTIFGRDRLVYPNVFRYIAHMRQTDGFFGMYRAVIPRIIGGVIGGAVQSAVNDSFPQEDPDAPAPRDQSELVTSIKCFCIKTSQETVSKCLGIAASQPFNVIMLRSMAQFVGGETKYNGVFSAAVEIYQNEGILGFFAGLVPRLLGEVLTVWLANILAHLINTYLVEDKDMKNYTGAACGLVVTHITYPFSLVSNLMSINGSSLLASMPPSMPIYNSWVECWKRLSSAGQLKRGSSLFWRFYSGRVIVRGNKLMAADYEFSS